MNDIALSGLAKQLVLALFDLNATSCPSGGLHKAMQGITSLEEINRVTKD